MAGKLYESAAADSERWGANQNRFPNEIARMRQYFNERFAFLDETYNRVNVLPASHEFTSANSPQTFTLVAYGEMMDLNATLQNTAFPAFEIVSALTQTPTGNGGYLATICIVPRDGFLGGTRRSTLVLSGTNQGNPFLHRIPLSFTNNATNVVGEHVDSPLQVFPNPVTDKLHIVHDWQSGDVVELFDMNGRRVFSQPVTEILEMSSGFESLSHRTATVTIDMSPFPRGNYILRIGHRVVNIVKR